MEQLLIKDELNTLAKLVGKKLQFVAGNYLTPGLNSDSVYVQTDNLTVSIAGELSEQDFGGFEEEFASLKVTETSEVDSLAAKYVIRKSFLHSGEEITGVCISRLRAVSHVQPDKDVSLDTERAIILQLSGGSLAIALRSLHLEMIEMAFAEVRTEPQIRELSTHYMDENANRFEFSESVITLDQALSRYL